jgi:hypothetical protein
MKISLYCCLSELHPLEEEASFDISFGYGGLSPELYVPKTQDVTPQIDLNIQSCQKIKSHKIHHNVSIYVCMYVRIYSFIFFVYGLFKNDISGSDYTASNDRMTS